MQPTEDQVFSSIALRAGVTRKAQNRFTVWCALAAMESLQKEGVSKISLIAFKSWRNVGNASGSGNQLDGTGRY